MTRPLPARVESRSLPGTGVGKTRVREFGSPKSWFSEIGFSSGSWWLAPREHGSGAAKQRDGRCSRCATAEL